MGIVEELAKLQQLKQDGALTEEEFATAKQHLLAEGASTSPGSSAPTVNVNLKDGLNELVDDDSTLGGAANRYVDFKFASLLVGAIIFIIMLIFMATMFHSAQSTFQSFPRMNGFP